MRKVFLQYATLITAFVLLLMLIAVRMVWHSSFHFGFLLWNLFLAILPLAAAHLVQHARKLSIAIPAAAFWLLFFPNSAYLLTDIVHLRIRPGAAFWLDLVILFGAGLYGVAVAIRSLAQMESWYARYLSPAVTKLGTAAVLLASGYGIYLGRVERWNSWDIVTNTGDLLSAIAYEVRHPFRCIEVWMLSGVFAAALGLAYLSLAGMSRRSNQNFGS